MVLSRDRVSLRDDDVDDAFRPHCSRGVPGFADQRHGRRFAGQVRPARVEKVHRSG